MAKKRYINTKFWSDDFIISLKPLERYFFLYLLTNEHTDICGIYELSLKVMTRETDLTEKEIIDILRVLEAKIAYVDGWVSIKNFEKHQAVNPKVIEGIKRSKESIPQVIMAQLSKNSIDYDSLSKPTNNSHSHSHSHSHLITVPNGTGSILIQEETMQYEELTYEPLEGSKKKSTLGKSTMFILARAYLDAKGIELNGEQYDANKISKGLSKLYHECKKDPDETIRRIKLGGEYFKEKELDWTPEAVWRRWEDINQWESKKYNSDLYE